MNVNEFRAHYLHHAVTGEGNARGKRGTYAHNNGILYYGRDPSWRTVPSPSRNAKYKGKTLLLIKWLNYTPTDLFKGLPKKLDVSAKIIPIDVPDLGVFSQYANDWLEPEEMFERIRFIFLARLVHELETVKAMTMPGLGMLAEKKRETIAKWYQDYDRLNEAAQRGWKPMPKLYLEEFDRIVKQRKKAYETPAEVEKRERAHAKRVASKALGLSTGKK